LVQLLLCGFRGNAPQELDVLVGVEARQISLRCARRLQYLQFLVNSVSNQKLVNHSHSMGFHWMSQSVIVVADVMVVKVRHAGRESLQRADADSDVPASAFIGAVLSK
jgi:hypothetical protein